MELHFSTRRDLLQFFKFVHRERSRLLLRYLLLEENGEQIYISRKNLYSQRLLASSSISDDIKRLDELGVRIHRYRKRLALAINSTLQSLDFFGEESQTEDPTSIELLTIEPPLVISCEFGSDMEEDLPVLDMGTIPIDDPLLLEISGFFNSAKKIQIPFAILKKSNKYLDSKELVATMKQMEHNKVYSITNRIITFKELAKLPIFDVTYGSDRRARVKMVYRGIRFRWDGVSPDAFRKLETRAHEGIRYVYDM